VSGDRKDFIINYPGRRSGCRMALHGIGQKYSQNRHRPAATKIPSRGGKAKLK
jgi:hypothetical protein